MVELSDGCSVLAVVCWCHGNGGGVSSRPNRFLVACCSGGGGDYGDEITASVQPSVTSSGKPRLALWYLTLFMFMVQWKSEVAVSS